MKRKVVQQGAATLMVSLPASWARAYHVKKGTEINVEEKGNVLHISSTEEPPTRKIELDVSNVGKYMSRLLEALYKSGYDEVRATFNDAATLHDIQSAIEEVPGFEIVDQGKNSCVIQDIEGVLKERFDPALKRTFYLLLQMADESLKSIEQRNYDSLKALRYLEESNNRFTSFCGRTLSKRGYDKPEKIHFMYLLVEGLEQLADQYKFMFDFLMQPEYKKLVLSKAVLSEYAQVNAMLREYYQFFSSGEQDKMADLYMMRKTIIHNATRLFVKVPPEEAMVLHYLLIITQMLFEMTEVTLSVHM